MVYTKFLISRQHTERCQFVVGYAGGKPVECEQVAVGFRGWRKEDRVHLCSEHFDYGLSVDGVRRSAVRVEK